MWSTHCPHKLELSELRFHIEHVIPRQHRCDEWIPGAALATSPYTEDIEAEGAKDLKQMPHLLGKRFPFLSIAL